MLRAGRAGAGQAREASSHAPLQGKERRQSALRLSLSSPTVAQRAGLALLHFALGKAKLRGLKVNDWLTKVSPQELREALAEPVRALKVDQSSKHPPWALDDRRFERTFYGPFLYESLNVKAGGALLRGGPSCMAAGNYVWILFNEISPDVSGGQEANKSSTAEAGHAEAFDWESIDWEKLRVMGFDSGKTILHAIRFPEHLSGILLEPDNLKAFYEVARKANHAPTPITSRRGLHPRQLAECRSSRPSTRSSCTLLLRATSTAAMLPPPPSLTV